MNTIATKVSRDSLGLDQRRLEGWPTVDTSRMPPARRLVFERRFGAVSAYMHGDRLNAICATWKISAWEVRRLRDRCLRGHPDGRLWGFRALVPATRTRAYLRTAAPNRKGDRQSGCVGLLACLLAQRPEIEEQLCAYYLKKCPEPCESRMPIKVIHKRFIELCRKAGVKENEYPFTTKYLGIRSLSSYLKALAKHDLTAVTRARFGIDAARHLSVGTGITSPRVVTLPLQRVQFDGHKIDAVFLVRIPLPGGGYEEVVLPRLWLLAVQDVVSRAILGWHLSLNPEYSSDDVLRCVRNAVEPRPAPAITIPGLALPASHGIPSTVIPEMAWGVWSEFLCDNGKANLANRVRERLGEVLGCAVNVGPVRTPERRGIIEAFFGVLEENSFHRLPNTVGSGPRDARKVDPARAAIRFGLTLDHLLEVIHVVIAGYNAHPHPHLSYRSPLEMLRFHIQHEGMPVRHLNTEQRARIGLLEMSVSRRVRGAAANGRRPYVQFEGERYSSQTLAQMTELIGTELTLVVNTDDLRAVQAFLPDGTELGLLSAMGRWAQSAHSLATRRAANRRQFHAVQHFAASETVDAVHVLLDHLGEKAKRDRRAAAQHEAVRREAGLPADYQSAPVKPAEEPRLGPREPRRPQEAIIY